MGSSFGKIPASVKHMSPTSVTTLTIQHVLTESPAFSEDSDIKICENTSDAFKPNIYIDILFSIDHKGKELYHCQNLDVAMHLHSFCLSSGSVLPLLSLRDCSINHFMRHIYFGCTIYYHQDMFQFLYDIISLHGILTPAFLFHLSLALNALILLHALILLLFF